jgi:hypothetical protein
VRTATGIAAALMLLAAACSSDGAPQTTPTPTPATTPLTTATADTQRAERAEVLAEQHDIPGVAPVLVAIEARDASTLVAQMYRHRGYCESPLPSAGTVVPADRAHLASAACYRGEVRYRGVRVEGVAGGLWSPLATRALLEEAFRPGNSWAFAGVTIEEYQTVTDAGVENRVRYLLRVASERTVALQLPGDDIPAGLLTFTIDLDANSAPQPDAIVELRLDERSTDQRVRVDIDSRTPAPLADVSPSVRARLEATPELAAVLPALEDLDALIAALGPFEAQCLNPPLPGKERPELCEDVGSPPDGTYEAVTLQLGVSFPIAVDRFRATLAPLFEHASPPIVGAWRIDPFHGDGGAYRVALGGPLLSETGRDAPIGFREPWQGLMLAVNLDADPAIEWVAPIGTSTTLAEYVNQTFDDDRNFLTDLAR